LAWYQIATWLTQDSVIDIRRKGTPISTSRQPEQKLKRATRQKHDSAYKEERRIEREEWLRREAAKETLIQNVFKHSHELENVDIEDQERVERWLAEISVLVDDFREFRELFPVDRVGTSSPGGVTCRRLMTTYVFQWRLARSIRHAKCLRVNLRKKICLRDWRMKLGRRRVSCWYSPAGNPIELFCR
jgi:hypothetical protein